MLYCALVATALRLAAHACTHTPAFTWLRSDKLQWVTSQMFAARIVQSDSTSPGTIALLMVARYAHWRPDRCKARGVGMARATWQRVARQIVRRTLHLPPIVESVRLWLAQCRLCLAGRVSHEVAVRIRFLLSLACTVQALGAHVTLAQGSAHRGMLNGYEHAGCRLPANEQVRRSLIMHCIFA